MTAKTDKVVYLKREGDNGIKAYVVDYIFDTETGKTYVIVAADSKGSNAKVYEVKENEAFVLSKEKIALFQGYKTNNRFQNITAEFKDGLIFNLIKKEEVKKVPQVEESIYYVFDQGTLRSYQADMTLNEMNDPVFSNIKFLKTWKNVKFEDIGTVIEKQNHDKSVILIADKMNDLEFSNGKVTAVKWSIIDSKQLSSETSIPEKQEEQQEINSDEKQEEI